MSGTKLHTTIHTSREALGTGTIPIRSDEKPDRDFASPRGVNYFLDGYLEPERFFTEVGSFPQASSAYGTFDQAGNALEWTEGLVPPFLPYAVGSRFRHE